MSTDTRSLANHQRTTLLLLFLAGVVNFMDRVSLSVASSQIRAEMHLNATRMGLLLSAFSLAYGLGQLPVAALLRRYGTRSVLGAGLGIWSLAQLLTSFAQSMNPFLALRALLGLGESPFYPAGVQSVREWFSANSRSRATAAMSASQNIGLAIAPPLLTWFMLRAGWRAMFFTLGTTGLIVSALWLVLHRTRQTTKHALPADAVNPTPIAMLLRNRTIWGMMIGWGGVNYTAWLYITWLPGYLQTERHVSVANSGLLAALPFLAGAVGMFTSGFTADHFAKQNIPLLKIHRNIACIGTASSALCTFLVAHAPSTAGAVTLISLALFFIHLGGTAGWGMAQNVALATDTGTVAALQNFFSFMIASVAPVLTGFIIDRTHSFSLALTVCSTITLGAAVSYAFIVKPRSLTAFN